MFWGGGTQPLIGNIDTVNAETYSDKMQYGDYLSYGKVDKDMDGTYDYIEISDCDESVETVDIPSEIDGLPVTSIGNCAFMNCCILEKITIPENVTFIGACAFASCKGLTSITIPEGVKTIVDETFSGCENLTSIIIPESVEKIGYSVFANCKNLTSITIPENVISIENGTFWGCINLTSINVSENNTVYSSDDGVLLNKNKTELICVPTGRKKNEFPESVTSIGNCAFGTGITLTSITLPEDVTSIGYRSFAYCENLTSITIENPECEIYDSSDTISNGSDDDYNSYYNGVIRGYENSTAQAYAEKYNYKFEIIGEDTPVSGDIDGDGKATLYDAIIVCKCIINAKDVTEEQKKNADVNGDGRIDLYDAIYVAECMIGKHN